MTTLIGGGTGPAEGTRATTCTPSPWAIREMLLALDEYPVNVLLLGKGNTVSEEGLREQARAGVGGFKLHEDWGTTPGGDRRVPADRGRDRRAGGDPHRHAQRGRLRAVDARRDRRAVDPRLPHRRRGRRPRAGHHHRRLAAQRHPGLDQPDAPAHGQHRRRAPGHAHRLPPPQPEDPRGSRVRRVAHPRHDDRRRGHPARPRRDLDHRQRLAGDGPRRRDDHPHLADRARDGRQARRLRRTSASSATSPSTRSARRSRTGSTPRSARSRSASSPTWCCGTRRTSPSGRAWC